MLKKSHSRNGVTNASESFSVFSSAFCFFLSRKLLLLLLVRHGLLVYSRQRSMMSFSVFFVCPFVSHRFGIICAFVSNANAQDGVNALPTALRHTTEDTATYFNHTRKVQFLSCHRSKLIWHPFNLSYLFSSTFYSPTGIRDVVDDKLS